jgi:hypothetical protein
MLGAGLETGHNTTAFEIESRAPVCYSIAGQLSRQNSATVYLRDEVPYI